MASKFQTAQTLYNEILSLQAQYDALSSATAFEDTTLKIVDDTRLSTSVTTTSDDFTALKTFMLARLESEINTKTSTFNETYPCVTG